jgi:hypothetical protein
MRSVKSCLIVLSVAGIPAAAWCFGQSVERRSLDEGQVLLLRPWAESLAAVAGQASSLSVSVESGGSNSVAVGPGDIVNYEVIGILSDDLNEGLALAGFDLDFDGGDLSQADTPTGDPDSGCENPMIHFTIPWGLTNPAGYGGTVINGDLIQIGGAQNTTNNATPPFPIGSVLTGVAKPAGCGPAVLVTGSLAAPVLEGTYTLALENLFANLIRAGEMDDGTFWATQAAGVGTITNLTIEVSGDCNENGLPDAEDLADCDGSGWCADCNGNGLLDECDVRDGIRDTDANGVPDACESGACCDGRSGFCTDDVPWASCPRFRGSWSVNLRCADLDPPCATHPRVRTK